MKDDSDDDEEICYEFKVVLIGESGVGKSSIIKHFVTNTFKSNETPSISSELYQKTIEVDELGGKKISFQIWDTVGQEKYRSMSNLFYKNAKAAIFVYDITQKDTFKKIKDYWYNQVMEFSPNGKYFFNF